jgi:hypothetical protein
MQRSRHIDVGVIHQDRPRHCGVGDNQTGTPFFQYNARSIIPVSTADPHTYTSFPETVIPDTPAPVKGFPEFFRLGFEGEWGFI